MGASVAPHGGTRAVFTPDPLAFGFPTEGDPVLIDLSAALTTNGMTTRLHKRGERLAHPWLLTADGEATNDPAVLFAEPPGTILPTGGVDAGHKGYALALIVEMLTGGLAGFGRADAKQGWGATVFVQAIDPAAVASASAASTASPRSSAATNAPAKASPAPTVSRASTWSAGRRYPMPAAAANAPSRPSVATTTRQ